jgi:hypothetical protein
LQKDVHEQYFVSAGAKEFVNQKNRRCLSLDSEYVINLEQEKWKKIEGIRKVKLEIC